MTYGGVGMRRFEPDRYYLTTVPELELLGTPDSLANQRSRGEGPRYHKVGKRVLYLGADLNRFLDECAIDPTSGPCRLRPDDSGREAPAGAGVAEAIAA